MADNQDGLPPAAITDTLTLILQQLQELKEENRVIKAQLSEKLEPSLSKDKGPMRQAATPVAPAQTVFINIPDKVEEDLEKEQYSENHSRPSQSMVDKSVMEKLETLTRKVQGIQFQDQGGFNPSDLTLFPEIRLPANFQMPDFDKYDGVGCPITHLQMFTIMCQPQGLSSEQMAQLFPVSLTKVARRWFMVLDKTRYRTWKDIGEQFIRQFKYDDGTEITRKDLERTKQDLRESFLIFVKRWRRIAAQMMERPSEEEQVQIIMKNISPQLQYHMSLQYYPDFKHFIVAGTQIEEAMAQGVFNRSNPNPRDFKKSPPAQVNSISRSNAQSSRSQEPLVMDYAQTATAPRQQTRVEFTPLPIPSSEVLKQCLASGRITLPAIRPPPNPLPASWRADLHCEYHRGPGHLTDNCIALKFRIQKLIDEKVIAFQPRPNVTQNPLPGHANPPAAVNAITIGDPEFDPLTLICALEPISEPQIIFCDESHLRESVPPLVITYEPQVPQIITYDEPELDEVRHVTRGGRIFKPVELRVENPGALARGEEPQYVKDPDDEVVQQLKKTQAVISVWGLLIASKKHREAVLKELNTTQVSSEISPEQLAEVVALTQATRAISFSDQELPPQGRNHARALHVTIVCGGKKVPSVLVDNGSALNVCPLRTAITLGFGPTDFAESTLGILAYDNTRRNVVGVLTTKIVMGGQEFEVEFQVIDIKASFNMLLGRPWLHKEGAVASTLHQKLKFIKDGKLFTVRGDEEPEIGQITGETLILPVAKADDYNLNGFAFEVAVISYKDASREELCLPFAISSVVAKMMRKMNYFPGMNLGRDPSKASHWRPIKANHGIFGLGYVPTEEEEEAMEKLLKLKEEIRRTGRVLLMAPYPLSMNGHFIKEGETFPYYGFSEPWYDSVTGIMIPGFEIFSGLALPETEPPIYYVEKTVEDWLVYLEPDVLESLFEENVPDVDYYSEEQEETDCEDMLVAVIQSNDTFTEPQSQIAPATENLSNWSSDVFPSYFIAKSSLVKSSESVSVPSPGESFSEFIYYVNPEPVQDESNDNDVTSFNSMKSDSQYVSVFASDFNNNDNTPSSDEEGGIDETPLELQHMLKQEEERRAQPLKDEIEIINIGTEDLIQEIRIGNTLSSEERDELINLLKEYKEVFAWSYKDMPGLSEDIVQHKLPLLPGIKPKKQKLRRMKPEWVLKVEEEVTKQLNAGFLQVVEYPEWLANIVPVPKKDGKVRMCVDFRDLNKASPKDDFPLPHIDILVDNTAGHELLSFMDGFSGYNQIKMAPEDMAKTSFITQWGTYCYRVMPFGLKNAGATYQRAATALLHDMIHREVEVYVDDMIVKAKERKDHIPNLKKFFERILKYQLRLNPSKCVFGVTSGKLLGFMVSQRGIEVDPQKIKAIQEMPPPRTEKEIRGFLGRIQFLRRFIAHLTSTCEPIFKLLKKNSSKEWTEECQQAFEKIKQSLSEPPIVAPVIPGHPLLLYLSVTETTMGCMLAQQDPETKHEKAVYYLSKKMLEYEQKYTVLEKTCLALVWATQRLRHYLLSHKVLLLSRMDPLKYLFEKPALTGRTARWLLLLSEFDITHVTQKSVKGRAIAEQLAEAPREESQHFKPMFPDEEIMMVEDEYPETGWTLYFDGAANQTGQGVGALLVSPRNEHVPVAVKLQFNCTNNMAEYEACIVGLEAALALGIENLDVYGDSKLIICQTQGEWRTKEEKLLPYHEYLDILAKQFQRVTFSYLPRLKNRFADALATLASMIDIPHNMKMRPITVQEQWAPAYVDAIEIAARCPDGKPWYTDIKNYISGQGHPNEASSKEIRTLQRLAANFVICGGELYRRSFDGIQLLCVTEDQAEEILADIHEGVCGPHMNGKMLARKILRLGYYWPTLEADCHTFVKRCYKCQIHANLIHVPPTELHSLTSPWPFSVWGIDIIGKISPKSSNGHEYILVAIDYFTKWVEAASYAKLTSSSVAKFIRTNIICRYGIPHELISDNGSHFKKEVISLCEEFKIKHHKSSPYRPQTNGAVEAANKNVKIIISKMSETYKDWSNKLPYALWAYRTSIRASTGATPYSLVYGMEAVLPVEIRVPSLRVLTEVKLPENEWADARYKELNVLDEKRLKALYHVQGYQRRIARAFNKKVKIRDLEEGNLVLKENRAPMFDPRGKFKPNWSGPYIVDQILPGKAVKLRNLNGEILPEPTNLDQLKRFYA
ncbi:uncharacterized protein LOC143884896 isoform X2 [Tasmannia lanceolata]